MNREHILKNCTWDDYDFAEIKMHSEFFKKEVRVELICKTKDISPLIVDTLQDFLKLSVATSL